MKYQRKTYIHFIGAYKFLSTILILFFSITCIYANDINLRVQHYTTEEGLSQNYVDCIYRDSRGFIWVGTWDGLNRFDGYNFITYRPHPNKNSLSDGFINAIAEDKNGDLWIATRNGINKFIFETEEFIRFTKDSSNRKTSISDNWITTLMFDKDNNLWIGTLTAGVEKITLNKGLTSIVSIQKFNVNFLDNKSITNENIYCLLQDHDGYIYIGSLLGLDRLDPKTGIVSKYTDMLHPYYFPATVVHSIFEDSEHILWIGTESGLLSIDHSKKKLVRYEVDRVHLPGTNKKALSHGLVKSIKEDLHGNILIGTLGGLHLLNKASNEFTLFPDNDKDEYSLNNKFINNIYCDKNGNVWLGTEKGGINKYNVYQKQFYFFAHNPDNPNSLNHNITNSIYEDKNYIWVGTAGGGLNKYNKNLKKFTQYMHNPKDPGSVSLNFISAITSNGNSNEIWIGTWGCGLNQATLSPKSDKIVFKTNRYNPQTPDGPPFSYISCIIYDSEGNLWIGRPDGLEIYDHKNKVFYTVQTGSAYGSEIKSVGCLYIDSKNNLWIGTTIGLRMMKLKKGLLPEELSKPDSIFHYEFNPIDSKSLNGNFIVAILEDKLGSMWFSVYGKGINKLEKLNHSSLKAEFTHFTITEGLSNNVVYGILEDNSHNLWLSTDRGLTKYNYVNHTTNTYFESDGLQSNQFYWSAYHKNKDGIMYFGGTKGLNYFNPDSIKSNPFLPNIVITDFKLFNQSQLVSKDGKGKLTKTISKTSVIKLNYNENIISFEFSSLNYLSPDKNQYKYKMEGFDKEWTTTNADRRYVTYTNLNPGTYYFCVMGSNNDGVWNTIPVSIKLIISPPWWQTVWFRIIIALLIINLLILIYVSRIRRLEQIKINLEKLVMERTSELKEKSEKLNESNKNLKTLNETKDKLFTIIAHDLKNPFNVILGMFDLLVDRYDKYDDKRKKEMLSTINYSSQNLYKLLENLLQWARTQTGNIEFRPETFSLKDIILSNTHLMEPQVKEKKLTISCNCEEKLLVYADINLTNTIFRNLLNNAIKFTKEGGITITVEKSEENKLVYVKIKDTGVGIDSDKLNQIFIVGGIHSTTGTKGETGTGLGLILCHEFIEKIGGTIWVESEKEKGSTFTFTIPMASSPIN